MIKEKEYKEKLIIDQLGDEDVYADSAVYRQNGLRWYNQKVKSSNNQLFEGVYGNSPEMIKAKKEILKNLSSHTPKPPFLFELDDTLLTDMNMPSSLAPIAPDDNTFWREQLGCREMNDKDRKLVKELCSLIIENAELEPILHRDVSSSGFPYFIKGSSYKKFLFNKRFSLKNEKEFEAMRKLLITGSLENCLKNEIYPIYTQGERTHAVKSTKERLFYNPEKYAKGILEFEKVNFEHPALQDLHCYDRRSMYALNTEVNISCQILNNALMHGFKKISDIVDYRGEVRLSDQLKSLKGERKIITLDKSKFGETFNSEVIHILFELLRDSKYKRLADIAYALLGAPVIYRSLRRDIWKPLITGLEHDLTFKKQSFKSGHGMVAFLGKLLGTIDLVLIFNDLIGSTFDLKKFLSNGYDSVFCKNSGDDSLISIDVRLENKLNLKCSLHQDNYDDFPRFLGYYYNPDGSVATSINRLTENLLLPERDYRSKSFPKLGIICKLDIYRHYNPDTDEVFKMIVDIINRNTGFDLVKWLSSGDKIQSNLSVTFKSIEDKIFASNPDIIHYKMDKSVVSPELLSHFYHTTEPEDFQHLLN